jgi:hypothetical protein
MTTAVSQAAPGIRARGPFPGLDHYGPGDALFFYGRQREARLIAANVRGSRLTIAYGPSGVGKSSVLLAGAVPRLEKLIAQALESDEAREPDFRPPFALAVVRSWADAPLPGLMAELHAGLGRALGAGAEVEAWSPGEPPLAALERWTERVGYVLLLLDQFEEYFVYHKPGEFDLELARILNTPHLRVNILLLLRDDALAMLDRFKGRVSGLYGNMLRLDYLDRAAAKEAILLPVGAYNTAFKTNVVVEDALVEAVLAAPELRPGSGLLGGGAGSGEGSGRDGRVETSFLQLVLSRIWKHAAGRGVLDAKTLEDLGGPTAIVRDHLEDAMRVLEPDERELAADIFHHLVTPARTKVALSAFELQAYVPRSEEEIEVVLKRLSGAGRILRRIESPGAPQGTDVRDRYEIFHDALADAILEWRAGVVAERQARAEREQLRRRVEEEELQRRQAQEQAEKERQAAEKERKAAHRFRVVAGVAGVFAVIASALLAVSVWAANGQRNATRRAQAAKEQAEASGNVAKATAALTTDPARALELALRAAPRYPTEEAMSVLRQAAFQSHLAAVLRGPSRLVAAGFSPDGKRLVTVAANGAADVRDARTGKPQRALRASGGVLEAVFSPDGGKLVTAGADGTTRLWDVRMGAGLGTMKGTRRRCSRSCSARTEGSWPRRAATARSGSGTCSGVCRSRGSGSGKFPPRSPSAPTAESSSCSIFARRPSGWRADVPSRRVPAEARGPESSTCAPAGNCSSSPRETPRASSTPRSARTEG